MIKEDPMDLDNCFTIKADRIKHKEAWEFK